MPTLPIPSPYNFVPLSAHVFFPDWAAQISQDVPFSDGISGWFDIEVEAMTPIYIRNGGDFDDGSRETDPERRMRKRRQRLNNPEWQSFYRLHPGGSFAIPGTTLKGLLRSVLEVAAFGKMRDVDNRAYSVRDLHNPDLYNQHLTGGDPESGYTPLARAGWLHQRQDGTWEVYPCQMARVEQADLEVLAGDAESPGFLGVAQRAGAKYLKWWDRKMRLSVGFTADQAPRLQPNHSQPLCYRRVSQLWPLGDAPASASRGTIVFTGQPQHREVEDEQAKRQGRTEWLPADGSKHMEFVFFDREKTSLPVSPKVQEDFCFIHSDQHGQPNDDFRFLLREFWEHSQDIPVFFLAEDGVINSVGLALMYRLPYRFTLRDLVRAQQPDSENDAQWDLAETIFGRVGQMVSSKGRVAIETLPAVEGTARQLAEVTAVLNNPKPSFYPNYLEQRIVDQETGRIGGDYATLMDADMDTGRPTARLRGWKRYPAKADGTSPEARPSDYKGKVNFDVVTRFRPLDAHVRFRGRIHVHNLHPAELGALLWAITWGERADHWHRLGMGKALAYGHVVIRISGPHELLRQGHTREQISASEFQKAQNDFADKLDTWTQKEGLGRWLETDQLKALLAIANPATRWPTRLQHPLKVKDFAGFKGQRLALLPVPGGSATPREPVTPKPHAKAEGKRAEEPTPLELPVGHETEWRIVGTAAGGGFLMKTRHESKEASGVLSDPKAAGLGRNSRIGTTIRLRVLGVENGRHRLGPPAE